VRDHIGTVPNGVRAGELVVEHAPAVAVGNDAVARPGLEGEELHPQHVARSSAEDGDRSGHHMGAIVHDVVGQVSPGQFDRIFEDVAFGNAQGPEERHRITPLVRQQPFVGDGVEGDHPAVSDLRHRFGVRAGQSTPAHRGGRRLHDSSVRRHDTHTTTSLHARGYWSVNNR
jgi:hypothetical protein